MTVFSVKDALSSAHYDVRPSEVETLTAHKSLAPVRAAIATSRQGSLRALPDDPSHLFTRLGSLVTTLSALVSRLNDTSERGVTVDKESRGATLPPVTPANSSPIATIPSALVEGNTSDFKELLFPAANSDARTDKLENNDIWGGFKQGPTDNCVTVAAIKAAMAKFGTNPRDIYKEVISVGEGFKVTMRDGFPLMITNEELEEAKYGAGFETGNDKGRLFLSAVFLFAVSAKRAQMEDNDGIGHHGFETAMGTLNDGESAGEGLLRLGLKNHMVKTNVRELMQGAIGTIATDSHDMAVVDGYLESYGVRGRLTRGLHWKRGVKLV
ncbi:hypothetical protein [Pseudomonas sp. SDO5271_S396]